MGKRQLKSSKQHEIYAKKRVRRKEGGKQASKERRKVDHLCEGEARSARGVAESRFGAGHDLVLLLTQ